MTPKFSFVSIRVMHGLNDDILAHTRISYAYFFCEENKPFECRVATIPKMKFIDLKSFIENSNRSEMLGSLRV